METETVIKDALPNASIQIYGIMGQYQENRIGAVRKSYNEIDAKYRPFLPAGDDGIFFEIYVPGWNWIVDYTQPPHGYFVEATEEKIANVYLAIDGEFEKDVAGNNTANRKVRRGLYYPISVINQNIQVEVVRLSNEKLKEKAEKIGLVKAVKEHEKAEKEFEEARKRLEQTKSTTTELSIQLRDENLAEITAEMDIPPPRPATPMNLQSQPTQESLYSSPVASQEETKEADEEVEGQPPTFKPRAVGPGDIISSATLTAQPSTTDITVPTISTSKPVATTTAESSSLPLPPGTTRRGRRVAPAGQEGEEEETKKEEEPKPRRSTRGKKGGKGRKGTHRRKH